MARNSSGTHTLPPSAPNPVIANTTITADWANTTLGDLSTEITDSLSRSGKGGMQAALKGTDGTVAAPAYSFTSETGSGWFRNAAGELRLAILGTYRIAVTAATTTVNNALSVASTIFSSGTVTATGALISKAITSGNLAQVKAPDTLAAGYEITLPTALPGSTLPVTMTSAGVLSTAQLVNAQQNFGTPSATTDVAIKSYVDGQFTSVLRIPSVVLTVSADGLTVGSVTHPNFSIPSVSRTGLGTYTITSADPDAWLQNTANGYAAVTVRDGSFGFACAIHTANSVWTVYTFSTAGAAADRAFYLILWPT